MIFDTEDVKTEKDFAGLFLVLTKLAEKIPSHDENFNNLVSSLRTIRHDYLDRVHQQIRVDTGSDGYE